MKVELEKTFPMPATTDVAWAFLQSIEAVAGCMPGAKITERVDDTHYKGTISVRVGPASMSFKGEIEVRSLHAAQRMLHLIGKGADTTGSSGASMNLIARIEPGATDVTSNLVGRSEVTLSGKAATFGGRMMGTVADQILKQFAGNFAAQVQAHAAAAGSSASASATPTNRAGTRLPGAAVTGVGPAAAAATNPGDNGLARTAASPGSNAPAGAGPANPFGSGLASEANPTASAADTSGALGIAPSPSAAEAQPSPAPPAAPTSANELNAPALLWAILRDWFRGLFRRKPA